MDPKRRVCHHPFETRRYARTYVRFADSLREDESTGENIPGNKERTIIMFSWALTFLIIALIAAVLGFGGVAGTAAGIAKFIFALAVILLIVSLLTGRKVV